MEDISASSPAHPTIHRASKAINLLKDGIVGPATRNRYTRKVRSPLLLLSEQWDFFCWSPALNVANLLLAQSSVRARELAIRSARCGARGRLVRQFLSRGFSPDFTLAGGGLGVLGAFGGVAGLVQFGRRKIYRGWTASQSVFPYLVFALLLSTAVAAGLGVFTAGARATSGDLREGLLEGGRGQAARKAVSVWAG